MNYNTTTTVGEVAFRYGTNATPQQVFPRICSSEQAAAKVREVIGDKIGSQEVFVAIYLDRGNHVLEAHTIAMGHAFSTVVGIREILRPAILLGSCCNIIVAHNHPSGKLKPSNADIRITQKIYEATRLFDLTLFDHVIVSNSGHYSFADEGMIG